MTTTKTYDEIKTELQETYPMVSPYHYWIITSPLFYPSVTIYNDESTRTFKHGCSDFDISRLTDVNFEDCKVYRCDGKGGCDNEGLKLSEFVEFTLSEQKTYRVHFVFDCSGWGTIYDNITCSEDNFSSAYKACLMKARIARDLSYDEPSILLSKEEVLNEESN